MKKPISLFIFKVWVAVGWANGTLHAKARVALGRVLDQLSEISTDAKQKAQAVLGRPVDIPDSSPELSELARLPLDIKRDVYICAMHVALLDQGLSSAEQQFLRKLRSWLELDEGLIKQIDSMIPKG